MIALLLIASVASAAQIEVYNKCPFTIWPGIQGSTLIEGGGFRLNAGARKMLNVPYGWTAGRIWARTGCDGNYNCDTGFCGNDLKCSGRGGEPPVSLAEFTLNGKLNQDYYDVSLVDGCNIPVLIDVVQGTFNTNGGHRDCKRAGGCFSDLSNERICPPELQSKKNGRTVACKSSCLAFNNDQYCCRGKHEKSETCRSSDWPKNYPAIFKKACPGAYTYAFDDPSSLFVCRGRHTPSPIYRVQFC